MAVPGNERDFVVNGESLVRVKGGAHNLRIKDTKELGLTSEGVKITPIFKHRDINIDDFGPDVPAEVMFQLAEVRIDMTLIHFDREVLQGCIQEALAGGGDTPDVFGAVDVGVLAPCGTMMGGLLPLYASGNHYVSVNILSEQLSGEPWNFPTCYLMGPAVEFPLGTRASAVGLKWRAIPYVVPPTLVSIGGAGSTNTPGEILSSGTVLWNRTLLSGGSADPDNGDDDA